MALPSFFCLLVGWLAVGLVGDHPYFQVGNRKPAGLPLSVAQQHYLNAFDHVVNYPAVCRGSGFDSFERAQCSEFENRLAIEVAIALAPFAILAVLLIFFYGRWFEFHRRGFFVIEKFRAKSKGKATRPVESSRDRFSWFFCMRPIMVEISPGRQQKAYLALNAPLPFPGQDVALISLGKVWGKERFTAVIFAPNLAVVA